MERRHPRVLRRRDASCRHPRLDTSRRGTGRRARLVATCHRRCCRSSLFEYFGPAHTPHAQDYRPGHGGAPQQRGLCQPSATLCYGRGHSQTPRRHCHRRRLQCRGAKRRLGSHIRHRPAEHPRRHGGGHAVAASGCQKDARLPYLIGHWKLSAYG